MRPEHIEAKAKTETRECKTKTEFFYVSPCITVDHFIRSVTMMQLWNTRKDTVAEQDAPGSDKLSRWTHKIYT